MNALKFISILLLAFGVRVFRLDGQSFWSDEGASVFMTGRNFGEILQAAAADIHPPLYYLLLRYWSAPTGTSEFAVRFLSLAFGVLLVALIYKLGEKLASRDVGLVAAFLAATSPFLVYYSQEARMYTQMAALSALSVVLALRIWEKMRVDGGKRGKGQEGKRPIPLSPFSPFSLFPYIFVTAACLYTQYYSFTIVLFEDIVFALVFWRVWRYWRGWLVWIGGQLAVALLFLPWLIRVMGQLNSWPAISEVLSIQTLAYKVFLVFSFGLSWDVTATDKTQALFAGLLIVGVVAGGGKLVSSMRGKERKGLPSLFPIVLYLAVPIGIMYYLSLSRPMYNPKFLLVATPPFYVLLGLGVIALRDMIRGIAFRFSSIGDETRLPAEASTPGGGDREVEADKPVGAAPPCPPPSPHGRHRGSATTETTKVGLSGDVAVAGLGRFANRFGPVLAAAFLMFALAGTTFATSRSLTSYYFDQKYGRDDYRGLSRYIELSARPDDAIILNAPSQSEIFGYYYKGLLPVLPIPGQRPLDERVTEDDLNQAGSKYRRIWVVFWADKESDPAGFVERWLNQNAFRTSDKWFGNVRMVLYSLPTATSAGTIQQQVDADFGNKISLLGFSLYGDNPSSGRTDYDARPGGVLQLTLFWQALSKMDQRYTVFTHLVDPQEHIWGQRDAEPGSGARPTTTWTPGTVISDNYGIPVLFGTPPGDYYVEAGIYLPTTGERLPLLGQGGETKGDRVLFGPLRVGKAETPPPIASLNARHPASIDFGPLRLVSYNFNKLGSEQEDVAFKQGEIARLALFWQATDRPGRDHDVVVRILDANGRTVFTKQNPPADGNYPTGRWDKGEIVLDQHKLPLNLPPGQYRLQVGLDDVKAGFKELSQVEITGGKG